MKKLVCGRFSVGQPLSFTYNGKSRYGTVFNQAGQCVRLSMISENNTDIVKGYKSFDPSKMKDVITVDSSTPSVVHPNLARTV